MTKVLFCHGAEDRIQAAAAWIAKAAVAQRRITVFAPHPAVAERLDRQLWLYPPTGFVPHCRADSPLAAETSVVIASQPGIGTPQPGATLLNLSDEMPAGTEHYAELVEIISIDDAVRLPGRDRARQYKAQGWTVEFQEIGNGR